MYIFARTRTIDPARSAGAVQAGVEAAAKADEVTGLTSTVWFQAFAPTGSALSWTTRFDHLADLDQAWLALMDDSAYHDAMAELEQYLTGPSVEAVIEPVGGTPPAEPTQVVTSVQATAANGHLRAAMHWGIDLADRVSRTLDVPTIFGRSLWGEYGTVFWASYYEDPTHVEETYAKLAADEMLQAVIDEGAHNVQPGAASWVMRRVG